jgi:hypothetical protein
MWLNSFLASWRSRPTQRRRPEPRPARGGRRLALEHLDDRVVLTGYSAANVTALIADINAANKAGGANTITLTAPTTSPYVLTAVNNTTEGATGLPVIAANDKLTILGTGDTIERSTATGAPTFRLLDVAAGASLTLGNLTLQGGLAQGNYLAASNTWVTADGGAIYNQGALTLNGVTVQNNIAQGAGGGRAPGQDVAGGGIYSSASLTLEGNTTIENNQALGGSGGYARQSGQAPRGGNGLGGGVYVAGGTATLTNVTLSSNTALGGQGITSFYGGNGGNGFGGALEIAGGTITLSNSTLTSNVAQGGQGASTPDGSDGIGGKGGNGFGGALQVSGGTASVTSSVLSANIAQGGNGGIYGCDCGTGGRGGSGLGAGLEVGGGTVTLISDTLTTNHAYGGSSSAGYWGPRPLGEGGGIYIASAATVYIDPFTLANVISNTASTSNSNIFGTYIET